MPIKYVKMWKDGSWQKIQEDRVQRFLEEGWTTDQPILEKKVTKSTSSKNKISADAQVTSKTEVEADASEHVHDENCEPDCEIAEWDPTEEDWADSEESMSVDSRPNEED